MIFKLKTLNFTATKILELFENVDIYIISISNKISSCEKNDEYFIDHKDDYYKIKPLSMFSQLSSYAKLL